MSSIVEYILSLKSNQFDSGINSAIGSTNGLENAMNNLGNAIGVTFGVAGLAMFTKGMIEAGTAVEDARVGLTTLLKSSDEAGQVIKNTMSDAMTTPFAFEGLLMANKALISAGVSSQKAREDVLNLGNAIAATGGNNVQLERMVVNMQQIANVGYASARDIKEFSYAGVNIYKALEAAGITIDKNNETTKITYEQLTLALKKAHEEGGIYFNGLENMAGNTSIQISNLGDAFFQLKVQMFNDLKPAITATVNALSSMITTLKHGWEWLVAHKETIKSFGDALGIAAAGFVGYKIAVIAATAATEGFVTAIGLTPWGAIALGITGIAMAYARITNEAEAAKYAIDSVRNAQEADTISELNALLDAARKRGEAEEGLTQKIADEYGKRKDEESKALAHSLDVAQQARSEGGIGKYVLPLTWWGVSSLFGNDGDEIQNAKTALNKNNAAMAAAGRWAQGQNAGGAGAGSTKVPPFVKSNATKSEATGHKSITFNIKIDDLVKTLNVNTTNIREGAKQIHDMVTGVLVGAVNDFQRAIPE